MASFSLALPGLERWERPTSAPLRASGVQPGRLAQGPDEKKGRAGRTAGVLPWLATSVMSFIPSRMIAPRWGGVARRRYRQGVRLRQREIRDGTRKAGERFTKAKKMQETHGFHRSLLAFAPRPPAAEPRADPAARQGELHHPEGARV